MYIISMLLVIAGITLLLYSLGPTSTICQNVKSHKVGWRCLYVLILFFIAGYGAFLYSMGSTLAIDTLPLIIAAVFFGGSIFVFLVANLSLKSILYLNTIATEKHFAALHDSLTGLPNRQYFNNKADSDELNNNDMYWVILMDLDKFKLINDLSGHHVGDQILITIAERFDTITNNDIVITRIGGDEFALLVTNRSKREIDRLARDIITLTKLPFEIENQVFNIGISIGISKYPSDGDSRTQLLKCADVAMYHAKGSRSGFSHYSPQLAQTITYINSRIVELERAILLSNIFLTYQPIVNREDEKISAIEVHACWTLDDGSEIAPFKFLPFARSNKLIQSMSSFVLENSLSELALWHQRGHKLNLHVNLAASDLQDEYIVQRITNILAHHNIAPNYLTIAFNESALLEDVERAITYTRQLSKIGVHIAITQFGTSFSSLDYLPRLGVDQIKLDPTFTKDLLNDSGDLTIAEATIRFAQHLNISVIAAHIDTLEIKDGLAKLRANYLTGNFFGTSLSPEEVNYQLEKHDRISHNSLII